MKLHIGVGKAYLPGWVNLDIFSNVKCDICSHALAIPYPQESFELIYASHIIEHLSRHLIQSALTHWRSLLKPGGVLRLAVPDFDAIVSHYLVNGHDLTQLLGLLYGGQESQLNSHYIVFNEKLLTSYLKNVGFTKINRWDWRKTEHSNFDDYSQAYLPHLDKTGRLMSLNIEAIK